VTSPGSLGKRGSSEAQLRIASRSTKSSLPTNGKRDQDPCLAVIPDLRTASFEADIPSSLLSSMTNPAVYLTEWSV
jgi:hypothetical protein